MKVKGVGIEMETTPRTKNRGFASMDAHRQREIARKGGRAAHEKGKAHEFTSDEARAAGRKGGEKVSVNRRHMAEIGRRGGRSSAQRRRPSGGSDMPIENADQEMRRMPESNLGGMQGQRVREMPASSAAEREFSGDTEDQR